MLYPAESDRLLVLVWRMQNPESVLSKYNLYSISIRLVNIAVVYR
jgi:hypothetical protein